MRASAPMLGIAALTLVGVAVAVGVTRGGAVAPLTVQNAASLRDSCGAQELLIGVRGTGETADQDAGLGDTIDSVLHEVSRDLQPIQIVGDSVDYVAVSLPDIALAAISGDHTYGYDPSVAQGREQLVNILYLWHHKCPNYRFVIAGYSQGADVAADMLVSLDQGDASDAAILSAIDGVALFGDPRYNPKDSPAAANSAATHSGLLSAVEGVRPVIAARLAGQVRSWCRTPDPVCSFNPIDVAPACVPAVIERTPSAVATCVLAIKAKIDEHFAYTTDGQTADAGHWLADRVRQGLSRGSTGTPVNPTIVPTSGPVAPTSGPATPTAPVQGRDCLAFVSDLSIPDGTAVASGAQVSKTWRVRNCGTTNWSGLRAVRTAGGYGPTSFPVPQVAPGASVDLTVTISVPTMPGQARATYRLQAADGHFAANSFWVEVTVHAAGSTVKPAPPTTKPTPPAPPVDRRAITSYDQMRGGAPHHGYFESAFQSFTAGSNTLTYVSTTVGTPAPPAGRPVAGWTITIRVCTDPNCATVLAEVHPTIVDYAETGADIGDIAVTPGATYYLVWYQPTYFNGASWVTYWWTGGSTVTTSDQMQAAVRGYNR